MKRLLNLLLVLLPLLTLAQRESLNKGLLLMKSGQFKEAVEPLETCYKTSQNDAEAREKSIMALSICYSRVGNIQEAIKYETQLLEIRKKTVGENHPDYAKSLNRLATYHYYLGNYAEAIRIGTESLNICKKTLGEEHPDYANSLINLASYNAAFGNYTEAINLGKQSVEINKKIHGTEHPDYAESLNKLASYNYFLGNYTEAIGLGTQAVEIFQKTLGEEHFNYATALSNLANYNSALGNYSEALRLDKQTLEIYKKILGENHPDYASSLNNLATFHYYLGNYNEAIRLGTESMEIRKKVNGENHPEYASSLSNLASYNSTLGNYNEAISLGTQAMQIFKKVYGEEHREYATSLNNIAIYNYHHGNNAEAIRLGIQALELRKKVLGVQHPEYAQSLNNLARYNFVAGNKTKAAELFNDYYALCLSYILNNFATMTYNERSNFWNKYSYFFSDYIVEIALEVPSPQQTSLAYNGQLLLKGLTLNTEIEIQKLIEHSNDPSLANRYNQIRHLRTLLDKLYQIPVNHRTMNVDSLRQIIENEERLLLQNCTELGDYTTNISIKWEDVQKKLKSNDLAVEFASFEDLDKNRIYCALVLKKGMKAPEMVRLFSKTDLQNIKEGDFYKTSQLYNLVWKPLQKYLDDVKNVYFSPCGKFHSVGIEYMPDDEGKIFAEKYAAYRLSSTRELALKHTVNTNKKALTCGGIIFGLMGDEGENNRGVASYIKGSKLESEAVANLLKSAGYKVTVLTGNIATEESFKNYSGLGISIMHIGTHGFYVKQNELENMGIKVFSDDRQSHEDRSLSSSGLLFAGANISLANDPRRDIPDGVDDGILTAKEISRLDFKGLDLVVLSACQSGLGEVTGEGVFGLQRGFKKAGARTLVMSLWNVSDEATQLLMTEFFKNLTSGKTKREAFVLAQKVVRQKFPHPGLWAAFVMVDGVE